VTGSDAVFALLIFIVACSAAGVVSVILIKAIAPPALSELLLQKPPAKLQDYKDVDNFLTLTKVWDAAKLWVGLAICGLFIALALLPIRYLEMVFEFVKLFAKGHVEPLSPAGERLVLLILAMIGPLYILTYRNVRIQAVILWVRRFHQKQRSWSIHRQLDLGCRGIASLITLQDSTIPVSLWAGVHTLIGSVLVIIVVCFASILLFLLVALPIYGTTKYEYDDLTTGIATLTVGVLVAGSLCFWWLKRKTVVRAKERNPRKALLKHIHRIRKSPIFAGGTIIVRCPENDTSWRDVIRLGIEQADAVVVDLTSFSENVVWELTSALTTHPPSKILLLYSDEVIADRQSLLDLVESHGCASAIVRCRWLVYPVSLPRRGEESTKREFIERLRRNLAACLISSRQREVSPYPVASS
jgi:hypothetical protein